MYHSNNDLNHITKGLLEQTLPKAEWTHAAHFAAALYLIKARCYEKTKADIPDTIRQYNVSVGTENSDHDGYHHTITLASLAAARDVLTRYQSDSPLFEIANHLISGPYGDPNWLLDYWSQDKLFSVRARRNWATPDIKSLPFSL